jgi:hypothetical protein
MLLELAEEIFLAVKWGDFWWGCWSNWNISGGNSLIDTQS